MNTRLTDILKKFEAEDSLIKDFQLFCAKKYDTIMDRQTTKRWILKNNEPTSAYKALIFEWDEQYGK